VWIKNGDATATRRRPPRASEVGMAIPILTRSVLRGIFQENLIHSRQSNKRDGGGQTNQGNEAARRGQDNDYNQKTGRRLRRGGSPAKSRAPSARWPIALRVDAAGRMLMQAKHVNSATLARQLMAGAGSATKPLLRDEWVGQRKRRGFPVLGFRLQWFSSELADPRSVCDLPPTRDRLLRSGWPWLHRRSSSTAELPRSQSTRGATTWGRAAFGTHWGGVEPALRLSAALGADTNGLPRRGSRSAVWDGTVTQRNSAAKSNGSTDQAIVFVVDDDASTRQALARLFYSVQLRVEVFPSAQEFLQSARPEVPSCLVLDVRLPGLSGLDFQAELTKADVRIPIVFITGHGDIPMSVQAMKAGAVDFLTKPFRDQALLDAVAAAIQRDQKRRERENTVADLKAHFASLTPREREIMALVASGLMSKQIAAQIELSEITVKVHRSHIMKKMEARSVADLVRMAEALGVKATTP
jgi:FixJ family two-component response regulator